MSIQKQELEVLKELEQLAKNPNEDTEKSESLVDEVTQELDSKEEEIDNIAPEEQEEKQQLCRGSLTGVQL